jgi:alpha-beta hydrolase superfamily lysophospholipase
MNAARRAKAAIGAVGVALALPASALGFDPAQESRNFSKINERNQHITFTPEFQLALQQQNTRDFVEYAQLLAADPERNPIANICANRKNECAGDVRFYDWGEKYGAVAPVLFTARSGATISGKLWATREGPARRPGIVITTGSVQAPETLYWGLAAALAKHGYVVLTYDVQGQGRSDTFGEGVDEQEGVPSQAGQPFYDGTEDALDFMLSTAAAPYRPRRSCGNANGGVGTSHAAKQTRRVAAGLNASHNPFAALLDADRIGIAGHSLGAGAVSFIGQKDPRVDAIVGWDNLRAPTTSPLCPAAPATRTPPPITKPALGMAADYGLTQTPYTADPLRAAKSVAFAAYRLAGVDSAEIVIRGGTHYEFSFIPGNTVPIPLGAATLRGIDMVAWYTIGWFDRYVKGGDAGALADAERRLLSNRWCDDAPEAAVDPEGDGNMFSFYYDSPLDIGLAAGGRAVIPDLRAASATPLLSPDGGALPYDHLEDARRPAAPGPGPDPAPSPDPGTGSPAQSPCGAAAERRGDRRANRLRGTNGPDLLRGLGGRDRLHARGGEDCVYSGRGADLSFAGPGNDAVYGQRGSDRLRAGAGRDVILGNGGNDVIVGGGGNDVLGGGIANDLIRARGGGIDLVDCGSGRRDRAIVGPEDRVSGCETVDRA